MPGPNKKISKVKIYDDTTGDHRLSPDGSQLFIGGSKFKRTVLPSVAKLQTEDLQINEQLDDLDNVHVKEADT